MLDCIVDKGKLINAYVIKIISLIESSLIPLLLNKFILDGNSLSANKT